MNGQYRLYVDQYGNTYHASSLRELKTLIRGRCTKMFRGKMNGDIAHVGYVIGNHWLTMYTPLELPA